MNIEQEKIITELIAFAGSSKSSTWEAINHAEAAKFDLAADALQRAKNEYNQAQTAHFKLVTTEQNPDADHLPVSLLLIHAEDQLMGANLLIELANKFIHLYKKLNQ